VTSLCVATATASHVRALDPDVVTFVETGVRANDGGEEDSACADYVASLLLDSPVDIEEVNNRVRGSRAAQKFLATEGFDLPAADLDHALQIDRFQFAMKVERIDKLLVLVAKSSSRSGQ
jgi:2-phosphosulfolactate phosphatase